MAGDAVLQLMALCAVVSFFWVTNSFERHSLVENPRLSSLLVLFIAACLSFLASFFSQWLPGANGRFDEDYSTLKKTARASLPRRPRRYFLPALILCIVLRLEIFHRVTFQFQCSAPGIESFLCTILVVYDTLSTKRTRIINTDPINPWDGPLDDLKAWLSDSRWVVVASSLALSHGTFLSVTQARPSTFFCSSLLDSSVRTISLQLIGLGLDATITILLWRVLVWSKTTRSRLRTLAGVLLAAAGAITALWVGARLYRSRSGGNSSFASVGSLYAFDVFVDGCAVAALVVSFTLVVCESSPVLPASTITFIGGLLASWRNTAGLGSWEHESVLEAIGPYGLVSIGFIVFLYSSSIRSVLVVRRFFLLLLLVSVAIGMAIFACVKTKTLDRHPVDQLVYDARIEADRWLRHASVSDSLKVAVDEYKERHGGRDPPPHFDKWFQFARDKKSPVIDHFQQIADDVRPFWGLKPGEIRERTEELAGLPRMAMLTVDHGTISHAGAVEPSDVKVMDDLVGMVESFATHLDFALKLPINLHDAPRVITPWEEVERHTQNGKSKAFQIMAKLDDRSASDQSDAMQGRELPPAEPQYQNRPLSGWALTTPRDLRHMEALACPPASPGRSALHWNVRDFCSACVAGFSRGQFVNEWAGAGGALDACAQPDLTSLHGFHLTPPQVRPLTRLMPVFSRAKMSHFGDVLLPLPHPDADDEQADSVVDFQARNDKPYWRGAVGVHPRAYRALRGDQRTRLLHLVNNATAGDEITMLLPTRGDKSRLAYEVVPAGKASAALGFDVRPERYSACRDDDCAILEQELGVPVPQGQWRDHKYLLLPDSETGPAPQTLSVLRSESLPLVATAFRAWYTERLQPWLHFVPLDPRWHGLHSTMAYFLGLKGRGALGGRKEVELEGRGEDARWIAGQGHVWAAKALRREDMEVYLFRLVLEWARVVDDGRDGMGFKLS